MSKVSKEDALKYHSEGKAGKIEVIPTKPYSTQRDLSLAYTPGVAEPCLEIEQDAEKAYEYTAKGNLVAVISNGTAVLGLGDIGALAGKPVMEGKGLLFKIFAGIDVFDIEVNEKDPDKFIAAVKAISPTFGGINLEDIKAPECFEIETRLKEELNIPVMHDDQHGTAIISGAGLLNALDIQGKKIEEAKLVVNGAGAAASSCTKLYMGLGIKKENIVMVDSNLQRENILPSERAKAYKMKMEAIKRQGARTDLTSPKISAKFRSDDEVGQDAGVSGDTIRNYIALTQLVPELQQMVDEKKIALSPAYQLAALTPKEQGLLLETIDSEQTTPSLSQAQRMKKLSQSGELNEDTMLSIMMEQKKPEKNDITLSGEKLRKYFPRSYTPFQIENTIFKLLDAWQKKRQRDQSR